MLAGVTLWESCHLKDWHPTQAFFHILAAVLLIWFTANVQGKARDGPIIWSPTANVGNLMEPQTEVPEFNPAQPVMYVGIWGMNQDGRSLSFSLMRVRSHSRSELKIDF